jgi:hypothetical protein
MTMPWLRRLVTGLPPRRSGFAPGSVHVGFVVDRVAMGQVFLAVLRFFPVSIIITPGLHTHIIWGKNNRPVGGRSSETLYTADWLL